MNAYRCGCGAIYKTIGTTLYCEYGAFSIFSKPNNILPAWIQWVHGNFCWRCAVLAAQHVVVNGYKEDGLYYATNKSGFFAANNTGAIAAIPPFEKVKVVSANRWKVGGEIITPSRTDFSDIRIQECGVEVYPEVWDTLGIGGKFAAALLYKQTGRLYTDLQTARRLLAIQSREVDRVQNALHEANGEPGIWMRHLRVMLVEDGKENQLYMASDMR